MLSEKTKKHINNLQQKKYRDKNMEFLVEGLKGVEEAAEAKAAIELVVVEEEKIKEKGFKQLLNVLDKQKIKIEYCSARDVKAIKNTETFPGILAVVKQFYNSLSDFNSQQILCLDGIKDPGNLGTLIRTANWFGIDNILLSEDCVDFYNPKVVRSTMGSIFKTTVFESQNIVDDLKKLKINSEYKIYSLTMNGKRLNELPVGNKDIYVIGSESHGVRPEVEKLSNELYTIPGSGQAESLNAAVAGGILMYYLKI